jgi:hypothetical protein
MTSRWTIAFLLALAAAGAHAGGAWLPDAGRGSVYLGFSRKTAHTSWDDRGHSFENTGRVANHDFRYLYLSGEVGLNRRLAATFLVTRLDGREGPSGALERNAGLSDAWFGLKLRLTDGDWKSALALTLRTAEFYDIEGPYSRDLYSSEGEFLGHSPEWRGLLREDYTLEEVVSRSFREGRYWATGSVGYTYRVGAPADQVPLVVDFGAWSRSRRLAVKVQALVVRSLGNDSERRPGDRFGSRPGFNFNDASMARVGASLIVPLGSARRWSFEAGYNIWVWGRSARQYEEPFVALGRTF